MLKMAACLRRSGTKGEAALSFWGKLRLGKQMRQCYKAGAGLGNEDKSADQRAIA